MSQKVNKPPELDLQIQERIEALLMKKGLSRRQLAERINIKEGYLGKMMRGERPWKVSYLKQVADGLDVPLEAILSDAVKLPLVAKVGDDKNKKHLDYQQITFDYHAVVSPEKDTEYVPYPEIPKSLASKTYVIEIIGATGIPELHPGMHLYVSRGLGNSRTLKDGDMAILVDETHRGFIYRVKRDDPTYIRFTTTFHPYPPSSEGIEVKKIAETVSGIDVVVAIVMRPDLLE
jgi:transcriptional regulator with XRE-family HTH domain